MSVVCPQCGSGNLEYNTYAVPGAFEYKMDARCRSCLTVFSIKQEPLCTIPSLSALSDKVNSEICKNSANSEINPGNTIPFAIYSAIIDALDHAKSKHPHFADTDAEAGNIILEELLEVNDAALRVVRNINDQKNRDNLLTELAQLNATTIRMMEMILK